VKAHCVVSNEFFDALPVHRIYRVAGSFREIYVAWQERGFAEQLGPASGAALEALAVAGRPDPADGWRGEACAVLNPVVQAIARLVERGVVLTIDYGYGDDERDLGTPGDSLVAYHRHQWTEDIFRRVGKQDLTSHVDFRAVLRLGRRSGLEPAGAVSQREFLLGRGLASDAEDWLNSGPGLRA
jgi:SAM-dependent MidA family methyltransferase